MVYVDLFCGLILYPVVGICNLPFGFCCGVTYVIDLLFCECGFGLLFMCLVCLYLFC